MDTLVFDTIEIDMPHVLRDGIDTVAYAASRDETRYNLSGIHFCMERGSLRLVATDGHRLHSVEVPCPPWTLPEGGKTVPLNALRALRKTLHKRKTVGKVTVGVGSRALAIERHEAPYFQAEWIDGDYPQWRNVVPSDVRTPCKLAHADRAALADAARALANARQSGPGLVLEIEGGKAGLLMEESGNGYELSGKASVEVTGGEAIRLGINGHYLADALESFHGDLEVRIGDGSSPLLFGDPLADFAVVMPLRR